MVECQHCLNEYEFEQALGVGDGQGSLVAYSPWGCKESDTEVTEHTSAQGLNQALLQLADLQHPLKGIQGGKQE